MLDGSFSRIRLAPGHPGRIVRRGDDHFQDHRLSGYRLHGGDGRAHVEYIAHYDFGLSRLDIRTSALLGAATFVLIVALLLATEYFEKLRKPK
jgi:hypothetical protein